MTNDKNPNFSVFCWNELMTPRPEEAARFYTKLLGWTTQTHDVGDMSYTVFVSGENAIGGMLQTPKDKQEHVPPPPLDELYWC